MNHIQCEYVVKNLLHQTLYQVESARKLLWCISEMSPNYMFRIAYESGKNLWTIQFPISTLAIVNCMNAQIMLRHGTATNLPSQIFLNMVKSRPFVAFHTKYDTYVTRHGCMSKILRFLLHKIYGYINKRSSFQNSSKKLHQ